MAVGGNSTLRLDSDLSSAFQWQVVLEVGRGSTACRCLWLLHNTPKDLLEQQACKTLLNAEAGELVTPGVCWFATANAVDQVAHF